MQVTIDTISDAVRNSPAILFVSVVLFVIEALIAGPLRIGRAKQKGILPPDHPGPPKWAFALCLLDASLCMLLFVLNSWYAFAFIVTLQFLRVLRVTDVVGKVILMPFQRN